MTARDLISALLRRWYVVTIGAALTLAAALVIVPARPVYFSEFEVAVLPPQDATWQNTLHGDTYGLVPAAGLLVVEFNKGEHPLDMGTKHTTLVGEGQFEGHRVRLQNEGNQWVRLFPDPVINVQVVDPDPEQVEARSREIVAALEEILRQRQETLNPPTTHRMSLVASPTDPIVFEITGSRPRAAGGLLLLGGLLTLTAVAWLERRRAHRAAGVSGAGARGPRRWDEPDRGVTPMRPGSVGYLAGRR